MARTERIELAMIVAAILALLAYSRIGEHRESPEVERQTAHVTEEATTPEGSAAVQTTHERSRTYRRNLPLANDEVRR